MCSTPRRNQTVKRRTKPSANTHHHSGLSLQAGQAASREEQLEKANAMRKQKQAVVKSVPKDTQPSFIEQILAKFNQFFYTQKL